MLIFHGIRFKNGVPERFEATYELIESLKVSLNTLNQFNFNYEESINFISNKINELYSPSKRTKNSRKKLSFLTVNYDDNG